MKNASFLSLILCTAFLSCSKGDTVSPLANCDDLTKDYVDKVTTFSGNPTKPSCEAMIKSLDNLVGKCSILTAAQRKEYQQSRNEVNCSDF